MKSFIPIVDVELSAAEIDAAVAVLRSGQLVQGPKTEAFEQAFAEHVGARHAIAVSSGTAALHIAYLALLKPGDEVLVPSFSHISTASMVHFAGCTPIFCDIDSRTFTIDLDCARERIIDRTKAIVPVHLFGNACDIDGIIDFSKEHDLCIIWDAAQAHGTMYNDHDVGSFDDLVCYSFYPTKNMFTGEGGMITTNDDELAERCRLLRAHGQTEKYYHPSLGFNYRMTDVEAAIGLEQLKRMDQMVEKRRANAARLTEGLSTVEEVVTPFVPEGVKHSYHQYTILLETEQIDLSRDEFVDALKEQGIGAAVHYPRPLHRQPAFVDLGGQVNLPVVEDLSRRILSLPVHPKLTERQLDRIVQGVKTVLS